MNYRHAFHAGNFADVVKHAVLARIVAYLKDKPAAFRVIDTHAGAGIYDLGSAEASRTGEWRAGIGKLLAAELPQAVRDLLGPCAGDKQVIPAFCRSDGFLHKVGAGEGLVAFGGGNGFCGE